MLIILITIAMGDVAGVLSAEGDLLIPLRRSVQR
jgi:hypothetical protein